jgi:calcineurin-like phosphoesterase family protein
MTMKKALSIIISLILICQCCLLFTSAKDAMSGITFERMKSAGIDHAVGYYETAKRPEKLPMTYEAWVYIPKSIHSSRVGAILGNYHSFTKDQYVNFEIHQNGVPRLVFGDDAGNMYDYRFTGATVPADTWTHVAIVYGTGSQNHQLYCYINGVLKHKTHIREWHEITIEAFDNTLCLAGDSRMLNEQTFRGKLGDVAIFSNVRSAEEIESDYKNGINLSDSELMMFFELSKAKPATSVPDKTGNGYDMTYYRFWLTEDEMKAIRAESGEEYEYVLAFLPDTQYLTQNNPHNLKVMFDYLVEQGKQKKIEYVIGLGDMTNSNTQEQWDTIIRQTDRLNGYIPYSLVPGNHDVLLNNKLELFNQSYAKKTGHYYQHVAANGGFFKNDSVRNTYLTFKVGEIDYLIINLDFGATDDILEWAGSVLKEHPEHRAIITTHGYLNADGTTLDITDYADPTSYNKIFNSGEEMWEKLISKHENIDMIVCGHMHHDSIVCTPRTGDAGNTVYQILMDPQSTCKKLGGLGAVGLMYFTADGSRARVEYYSTVFDRYFCESNKNIELVFEVPVEETTAEETTSSPVTNPTTDATEPATEEKGCGANVSFTAIALISLAAPLVFKKRSYVK